MYDFIGDIHGHAPALRQLLLKMGYQAKGEGYYHPSRKVFFVGDFIDRGPEIKATLTIVKSMVEAGDALAVMGNHEYNAICFATKHSSQGSYLRKRNYKNIKQHLATIHQLSPTEYEYYINWFKTLPLFYEHEQFRVVHATWDYDAIAYLKTRLINNRLPDSLLEESADWNSHLFTNIETVLKGKEMALPKGLSFHDKDGNIRYRTRIKWWVEAHESNIRDLSMIHLADLPTDEVPSELLGKVYQKDDIPVFFGHYWLKGQPKIMASNICCTDFSVAKAGCLAAYRWEGEKLLDNQNFVSTKA